jgi:hypothetical protein
MSEEQIYKTITKQMHAIDTPFRVVNRQPREFWGTNYAYYLEQKKKGGSLKPLLARMTDSGLQVFEDEEWVDRDLWKDYSIAVVDSQGNPVLNPKGNQRRQPLLENRKEFLLEFDTPVPVEFWDTELRQTVTEEHQTVWVRMSKSLAAKLEEQLDDPRNTMDNYFKIKYDRSQAPADQYKVLFVR